MKVVILSQYSGSVDRGVETWAQNLKSHLKTVTVTIVSGQASLNPLSWPKGDIFIPTNGRLQVLFCRLYCWLKNKPLVVFGHSGPGADDKWNLLCFPNTFVCFSQNQAQWARKFKLPMTKIEVIPHAVDTAQFTPPTKKPGKNIVLCVAANIPSKRIHLVDSAVKLIPNCSFLAVGPGNHRQVPYNQISQIYKLADVFCFVPVHHEAFGIVILEAMATNLPVVTIDDATRREIVGNAGILVKHPQQPDVLAQAISDALKKDWDDKPRSQSLHFSWDKIAEKYLELFTRLNP